MKTVRYVPHLEFRLALRGIPHHLPRAIFDTPKAVYWDKKSHYFIAIKNVFHQGKERAMMVAYQEHGEVVNLITIHPIEERQVINRVRTGRWKRQ